MGGSTSAYGSAVEACADFILLELDFWASRPRG
jgi:hypothetical protein